MVHIYVLGEFQASYRPTSVSKISYKQDLSFKKIQKE